VNRPGKPYRADLLARDLPSIRALYYDRGHFSVRLDQPRVQRDERRGRVRVELPVTEGPAYRLRKIRFEGSEPRLRQRYASLVHAKVGSVIDRSRVFEGIDRIQEFHRARGEAASVTPESSLDQKAGTLDLVIRVDVRK
jgi:outer membrane protein assembly factor BamA